MKILIVEDDQVSRKVLQLAIEKMGHEVVQTGNGEEALEFFEQEPTRVIVSDWMMPKMDGLELSKRIRSKNLKDYTYIILLTARVGKENYYHAMDQGVDDFLTKPLDQNELAIRLRVAERILGFSTQIRQLKELLPICMYCKKIRDDQDYWHTIESYIHEQTGTDFSHSVCPHCYQKNVVPQLQNLRRKPHSNNPQ